MWWNKLGKGVFLVLYEHCPQMMKPQEHSLRHRTATSIYKETKNYNDGNSSANIVAQGSKYRHVKHSYYIHEAKTIFYEQVKVSKTGFRAIELLEFVL